MVLASQMTRSNIHFERSIHHAPYGARNRWTGVSAGRTIKAVSLMWARMRLCCGVGENEDNK